MPTGFVNFPVEGGPRWSVPVETPEPYVRGVDKEAFNSLMAAAGYPASSLWAKVSLWTMWGITVGWMITGLAYLLF